MTSSGQPVAVSAFVISNELMPRNGSISTVCFSPAATPSMSTPPRGLMVNTGPRLAVDASIEK